MKKAYIYPNSQRNKDVVNPYIKDFANSISGRMEVLNIDKPSNNGIIDLFRYVFKIDFLFLNWVENISEKKGGFVQIVLFYMLITLCKIRSVKIVWTLHNKLSHNKKHKAVKKMLTNFVVRSSDFILTHSKEGGEYLRNQRITKKQAFFQHHPLENRIPKNPVEKKYDLLIWGALHPYKGVHHFLKFLFETKQKINVKIVGKAPRPEYLQVLESFITDNISFENRYVERDEMPYLINQAKYTVFTYSSESVLSSGALMDTLSYGGHVIAPNIAAFKDLGEEGVIRTYDNFDEITEMLSAPYDEKSIDVIESFIEENTWVQFGGRLCSHLLSN